MNELFSLYFVIWKNHNGWLICIWRPDDLHLTRPKDSACVYHGVTPEGSGVMVNGLLVTAAVFKEVGVVVVDFGIVRQGLDTRAETRKKEMKRRRRHGGMLLKEMGGKNRKSKKLM